MRRCAGTCKERCSDDEEDGKQFKEGESLRGNHTFYYKLFFLQATSGRNFITFFYVNLPLFVRVINRIAFFKRKTEWIAVLMECCILDSNGTL
jgi:hypothetical protein